MGKSFHPKKILSGARFSKVPRTFRARKAIRKITTCLFCKAGLFICCKGNKSKNNGKVSCLETPSFWRYKENYVTRNTPEKFRDFRETGPWAEKRTNQLNRVVSFNPLFSDNLLKSSSCPFQQCLAFKVTSIIAMKNPTYWKKVRTKRNETMKSYLQ